MAKKSKYNDAAMRYAMDYLDHLLELEDYVDSQVEKKLDRMVERKLAEQEHKHDKLSDASQAQKSNEIINQKQNKL